MPDQNFLPSDASAKLGITNPSVTTPVEPVPLTPPDNLSQTPPPLETPVIPGPLITEEVSTSSLPAGGSDMPPTPPIVEPAPDGGFPEEPPQGSAAPSEDIVSPIIDGAPKKKFGGKKMIATILGLLILVGGLGAGLVLVKQQQDIRERAAISTCKTDANCKTGYVCSDKGVCVLNATAKPTETKTPTATIAPTATASPTQNACEKAGGLCYETSVVKVDCSNIGKVINGGVGCSSLSQVCCAKAGEPTKTPTPTAQTCRPGWLSGGRFRDTAEEACIGQCGYRNVAAREGNCNWENRGSGMDPNWCYQCVGTAASGTPPPTSPTPSKGPTVTSTPTLTATPTLPPGATAQCLNIRAFDTSWNELSSAQLSALEAGNIVRFTVAGTATSGSFDMARFKINGVQRADVIQKRPGTQEFYDEYAIPSGVTTFTINAQIHHTTLGWSI